MVQSAGEEPQLLVNRSGSLGLITLNRPRALNSLTLEMVRGMDEALDDFEKAPDVAAVLVMGAGERGLCAGGDIRMIFESGKAGTDLAETFWREEYRLNARISHFPKPYLAILDGITMGGGVGISAHGSHRIATERLRLAMPETGIGFFPDVGATWLLTRKPGEFGAYLGLTGEIIGSADAITAGLADVFVTSDRIFSLKEALSSLSAGSGAEEFSRTIAAFAAQAPRSPLQPHMSLIDRVFAHETIEQIMSALEREEGEFAARTLATLRSKSPSSLKIALRLLRMARVSARLEDCLDREFSGSISILGLPDFYEGVRAAVIDKDRNPRWSPARLDEVTDAAIAHFFEPHEEPPFGRQNREKRA